MKFNHIMGTFFMVMGIINLQSPKEEVVLIGILCIVWGTFRFFGGLTRQK